MEEPKICQSCGMPMTSDEYYGSNADGGCNTDYCAYCYKDGAFLQDVTMDEMIEHCAQYLEEFNEDSEQTFTREGAIAQMKAYFPLLKRWQNA